MLARLSLSTLLALLGAFALTAGAYAQEFDLDQPDRDEIIFGTAIVVVALMAFLLVAFAIRKGLGLEQKLPPIEEDPHAHLFHDDEHEQDGHHDEAHSPDATATASSHH